jgi:hypothetical protein
MLACLVPVLFTLKTQGVLKLILQQTGIFIALRKMKLEKQNENKHELCNIKSNVVYSETHIANFLLKISFFIIIVY